ncbi:tyrosine-type recombinase/integrase, partial [Pseudomonas huaxiensis]|uniref:tyrosine-type recombinase/integrase n=1 Tax=Pseudomonas huaxiensis TaxID=2213017 RepID=UPI001CDC18B9
RKPAAIPSYIVPLSHQAAEIVRLMLSLVRPGQRYLFSHRSRLNERISENTLNSALQRLGYADRPTRHGMRATITTALTELGYPQQWIDAQLSHSEPNKVRAAYTHAQYVEQRRAMMQDWANRLDQLEQGRVALACERLTTSLEGAVLQSLRARGLEEAVGLDGIEPVARSVRAVVDRSVR